MVKTAKSIASFGDFLEVTFEDGHSVWFHDHRDGTSYREHKLKAGECDCGKTLTKEKYDDLLKQFPSLRKELNMSVYDGEPRSFKDLFEREMIAQDDDISKAVFDCNTDFLDDFILFDKSGYLYQSFYPTGWTSERIYLFLAQRSYVTVVSRLRNPK